MSLTERIQKAQDCSRDDDPTQHGKPQPKSNVVVFPLWRRNLAAKDFTRSAA